MKDEEVQDFYIEKPKNILRILFSLFFAIVGVVIMFYSFINKDYVLMIPGTLFTVIFIMFLFTLIKVTASPDPYITLTEEGLIIYAFSEHAILILWDDISGYHIRRLSFNRFIEVLFDHDKYLSSMSRRSMKLYKVSNISKNTLFAFPFRAIKRKDRRKLITELDSLVDSHPNLTDQIYHPEKLSGKKQKGYNRIINWKYFLILYAYNFGFTAFAIFIFIIADSESDNIILIVLYFILFPFAKLFYDVIIGFKLKDSLDKQEKVPYDVQIILFFHSLVYLFTIILAPLGIIYLIIIGIYRFIKIKWF